MALSLHEEIKRKLAFAVGLLVGLLTVGTVGYRILSGGAATVLDCLYMTMITVTTIGFGEIVDLSANPAGRVFTMFVALGGIGTMTWIVMSLTAFIVEGELKEVFRRRGMEKRIERLSGHYIVCGADDVGAQVARELRATDRPFVVVDLDRENILRQFGEREDLLFVVGDATDDGTLGQAGVARARGLFAATGDDNTNVVICLTARQLNPGLRVVARSDDPRHAAKMERAGADTAVSPSRIGAMRMASVMVRPAVVSFLDVMLRQEDERLRVEELPLPASVAGGTLASLGLERFPRLLVLAVRRGEGWTYNPPRTHDLREGDTLVFISTPDERKALEERLAAGPAAG